MQTGYVDTRTSHCWALGVYVIHQRSITGHCDRSQETNSTNHFDINNKLRQITYTSNKQQTCKQNRNEELKRAHNNQNTSHEWVSESVGFNVLPNTVQVISRMAFPGKMYIKIISTNLMLQSRSTQNKNLDDKTPRLSCNVSFSADMQKMSNM